MQKILDKLQVIDGWKQQIKRTARSNKVPVCIVSFYSPSKLRSFITLLRKRNQQQGGRKKKFWIQNQLRALHWTLLVLSQVSNKNILEFGNDEWTLLSEAFPNKPIKIFQYQAIKLVDEKKTRCVAWKKEQNDLLSQIINKQKQKTAKTNKYKWNDLARQLFQESDGQFFRTGKQCRQRWMNHLNPQKKHGQWTGIDDYVIANTILNIGKKWSQMARLLKNRTQHMVRSRYKSLVLRQKKTQGRKYDQTSLLRKIVDDYKGQPIFIQAHSNSTVITRHQLIKASSGRQNVECLGQNKNYFGKIASFCIIQQQKDQQKNSEQGQNQKLLFSYFIEEQNQLEKNISQNKVSIGYFQLINKNVQLEIIQSPAIWNHTAKTPGYYGFSPSAPFFTSFSQCENNFDFQYKKIRQNQQDN